MDFLDFLVNAVSGLLDIIFNTITTVIAYIIWRSQILWEQPYAEWRIYSTALAIAAFGEMWRLRKTQSDRALTLKETFSVIRSHKDKLFYVTPLCLHPGFALVMAAGGIMIAATFIIGLPHCKDNFARTIIAILAIFTSGLVGWISKIMLCDFRECA